MLLLISLLASDLANKGLPRQELSSKPGVVDGEVTATAAASVNPGLCSPREPAGRAGNGRVCFPLDPE